MILSATGELQKVTRQCVPKKKSPPCELRFWNKFLEVCVKLNTDLYNMPKRVHAVQC